MNYNPSSSGFSNAGSSGSSVRNFYGRKAPPAPKISAPAGGSGIPEQQQVIFAVPNPPQALAPVVAGGGSQTQENNENKRSSSSSPGQRSSKDPIDDEAVKQSIATLKQQFKVRADEYKNLLEKIRIKKRQNDGLLSKISKEILELAVVKGQVKFNHEEIERLKNNEQNQNTFIQQQSAKIQKLENDKGGLQAIIQDNDQQIGKLKRELDQERNDKDSIAQGWVKMCEHIKRKKLN